MDIGDPAVFCAKNLGFALSMMMNVGNVTIQAKKRQPKKRGLLIGWDTWIIHLLKFLCGLMWAPMTMNPTESQQWNIECSPKKIEPFFHILILVKAFSR